jgi:hypothetical protein
MLKRLLSVSLIAGAVLWGGVAPADDPEVPLAFISVDELKALMDKKLPVDLIDVRPLSEYVQRHIKDARSIPLWEVPERAFEIEKAGLVVFY